ncbi:MAG: hypothetical protein ACKV2Q_26285 [Planctomycetaceae bacterium]
MRSRNAMCRATRWLVLAVSFAMTAMTSAIAEDEVRLMPQAVAEKFVKLDRNGDRLLSLEEFQASVAKEQAAVAMRDFQLFDQDADGRLSREEYWSIPTVSGPDQRGPLPDPMTGLVDQFVAVMDKFFDDWDKDVDRVIPMNRFVSEFGATIQEPITGQMQIEADPNRDQQVTRKEARRFVEIQFGMRRSDGKLLREPCGRVIQYIPFKNADRNKDDRVDHNEFVNHSYSGTKAEEIFVSGDSNKDEFISWDEWCKIPGRIDDPINEFRRLDTNLNGKLNLIELMAGTPDWIKVSATCAFPGFDFDRDGELSLNEFRLTLRANPVANWASVLVDVDGDERISRAEFVYDRAVPLLRFVYFKILDTNGDGVLDTQEFKFKLKIRRAAYALNADGTGWQRLFDVKEYPQFGSPAVSPDGKRIAFDGHRAKEDLGSQVMLLADLDGQNLQVLGPGMMPNWNKDGTELVYSRGGIQILNLASKESRLIDKGWGGQWSPDGKKILYYSGLRIMLHDLETKESKSIYNGAVREYQQLYWNMTWSPDSQRIMFKALNKTGQQVIATVFANPAEPRMKVHYTGMSISEDFAWHPDGKRVAFGMHCPERKLSQIYELDPDADDPPKLMPGQDPNSNNTNLCWMPDGKRAVIITGDF